MSSEGPRHKSHEPGSAVWTRPEPGVRRAGWTREQIAQAALRIADTEGFEAVSMRRIAADLGAGTMTLYHYVRNKRELLSLMDDAVMAEVLVPEEELSGGWRAALTAIAVHTRAAFRRHPWAMEALRGAEGGPNGLRHFEQSLAAVEDTGLDARGRMQLIGLVDDYVVGSVTREAAGRAVAGSSDTAALIEQIPGPMLAYFEALVQSGEFPRVAQLAGGGARETIAFLASAMLDEERFERGLATLLDGVAQGLAAMQR